MIEHLLYAPAAPLTTADSPHGYRVDHPVSAVDDLLNQKTRILEVKLAVFASAIVERLRVRASNHERIDSNEEQVRQLITTTDRQARYHLREHHDKRVLYETLFNLHAERRTQDTECWRDIMDVMREVLIVWESLEQARSRSIFLDHARR